MNWKVGDTAVALFDVYLIKNSSDSDSHELKVRAGNLYSVLEVSEKDGHVLLDVGIRKRAAFFDYTLICIQCKPTHLIPVTDSYSNQIFNLSSWFKKIDPTQLSLEKEEEITKENQPTIRIFQGVPSNLPTAPKRKADTPKPIKKEPAEPRPQIKEEEIA
jgi:hypothetical protein